MQTYTHDWWGPKIHVAEKVFHSDIVDVLEVGCFEGRATCWFLEQSPKVRVTCIDDFRGELHAVCSKNARTQFLQNTQEFGDRVTLIEESTWNAWHTLKPESFDFVFVDAGHTPFDVLHDAVQAYRVTRSGGFIMLDDYLWGFEGEPRPKCAIDAFLTCFYGKLKIHWKEYVVVVQKL